LPNDVRNGKAKFGSERQRSQLNLVKFNYRVIEKSFFPMGLTEGSLLGFGSGLFASRSSFLIFLKVRGNINLNVDKIHPQEAKTRQRKISSNIGF